MEKIEQTTHGEPIRVLIVDDHPLVVEGLRSLLFDMEGVVVVGAAYDTFGAMEFLQKNTPDIAFLDINLPDISGIELCKKITKNFPKTRCIALSNSHERSHIARMMQNGAMGYLLKSASKQEIVAAIHQVMAGAYYMNVNTSAIALDKSIQIPFLTRREKEVLLLIAEGMTNPQIADILFVSASTVKTHRENLLIKFAVPNTAALIRLSAQYGFL